jgi:hypothetical protein
MFLLTGQAYGQFRSTAAIQQHRRASHRPGESHFEICQHVGGNGFHQRPCGPVQLLARPHCPRGAQLKWVAPKLNDISQRLEYIMYSCIS